MDATKVRMVLDLYQQVLTERGAEPIDFPHDDYPLHPEMCCGHCLGMIETMRTFLEEGRMDKVMRWLGFMQGVMWTLGIYTMDELKGHNRPAPGDNEYVELELASGFELAFERAGRLVTDHPERFGIRDHFLVVKNPKKDELIAITRWVLFGEGSLDRWLRSS